MCLRWVSAAEGQLFADYVTQFSQQTRDLGPFDPGQFKNQLEAIESAFTSPRLRWLMGMDIHLTERGNVFEEKLPQEDYQRLLKQAAEEEYQDALILDILKHEPLSVRQIAFQTGLPVYTVSVRLGETSSSRVRVLYRNNTPIYQPGCIDIYGLTYVVLC